MYPDTTKSRVLDYYYISIILLNARENFHRKPLIITSELIRLTFLTVRPWEPGSITD